MRLCLKLPVFIAAAITELVNEEGTLTLITLLRSNIIMEYPATVLCAALGAVLLNNSKTILSSNAFVYQHFLFFHLSPSVSNYSFWCSILLNQFVCKFLCTEANQKEADARGLLGLLLEVARLHSSSPALLSSCFTALTPMCDSGTSFRGVIVFILLCNSLV